MSKLVVFPSDPIEAYLRQGKSYEYLENYFNPGHFFDEVFCLSLYGSTKKVGGINYIRCKAEDMRSYIEDIKPDVVRAYGGYISSDLAFLSRVKGIPIVVSVHDTNPDLIHDSLKYADYVICMAECVKRAVIKKINYEEEYMWVMPNRIDTELFCHRDNEADVDSLNKMFGEGKHILHVGRKSEQKNLDTLIKALTFLPKETTAIFVGTGDDSIYKKMAIDNRVENRCYWIESVKKEELPKWYSWCDCFCTPSRWEGFGFVFIEAAGCEAPIVTSNIAPMNEYLIDGENAILVDEYENPKALADAIAHCLSGAEDIEHMKHNARKVGLKFDKKVIDDQEIDIYTQIIKRGARIIDDSSVLHKELLKKYKPKRNINTTIKMLFSKTKGVLRRIKNAI